MKREETGRAGAVSHPFFFLFPFSRPAPPTFRVPFSFASSPLSESPEQATAMLIVLREK